MKDKKGKRKRFFLIILLLGVVLALVFAVKNINISFLGVKEVQVSIKDATCVSEDQLRNAGILGMNILFLKAEEITAQIKSNYPCVKEVFLEKQYPSNVKVLANGRSPKVKVAFFKESLDLKTLEASPSSTSAILNWSFPTEVRDLLVADETGFIFGPSGDSNLPMLLVEENLNIGKSLESEVFSKVNQIFEKIGEIRDAQEIRDIRGKVVGGDFLIEGKPRVIFSLDRDVSRSLASLQLILNKAKIDGKELEIVDLRFDKPVVVYTPKKVAKS